jgi:hypothetical protein
VSFDGPSARARVILKFAPGRIEGVPDRYVDVFMSGVFARLSRSREFQVRQFLRERQAPDDPFRLMLDDDLAARHGEADADMIELSFPMMQMRRLDDDVTIENLIAKQSELLCFLLNIVFERRRTVHVSVCDLHRKF